MVLSVQWKMLTLATGSYLHPPKPFILLGWSCQLVCYKDRKQAVISTDCTNVNKIRFQLLFSSVETVYQLEPEHFMLVQAFISKVCPAWLELKPWITQGLKKELSCHPGQVDPAREVKFHSHLPMGGVHTSCVPKLKYIKRNINEDFPRASTIWELLLQNASWNSSFFEALTTLAEKITYPVLLTNIKQISFFTSNRANIFFTPLSLPMLLYGSPNSLDMLTNCRD